MKKLDVNRGYEVQVLGHTDRLFVRSFSCSIGHLENGEGVAFEFESVRGMDPEGVGRWVVPLSELQEIVEAAESIATLRSLVDDDNGARMRAFARARRLNRRMPVPARFVVFKITRADGSVEWRDGERGQSPWVEEHDNTETFEVELTPTVPK